MVASCSSIPNKTGRFSASSESTMKIIDAHIHTDFDNKSEKNSGIMYSFDELQKEMKAAGVVGAMSLQYNHRDKHVSLERQGIFYCGGIRENVNYKLLEQQLQQKKIICLKIYLGYVHKYANDPLYTKAYELAQKYSVPVVFHTGDIYDENGTLKHADPLTIDEVAVKYRKVNFVIAHMGNPWIQSAAEVAYKNPNVYLDGSAFFAGPMASYTQERIQTQMINSIKWVFDYVEDPKKVIYGTDWPLVPMTDYLAAFKQAIPRGYWHLVFYENAKNLFKMPIKE